MMTVLGIYIFNATRSQWLQDDQKSWGSFDGAVEFTCGNEEHAEALRLEVQGGDVTFTMAALH